MPSGLRLLVHAAVRIDSLLAEFELALWLNPNFSLAQALLCPDTSGWGPMLRALGSKLS